MPTKHILAIKKSQGKRPGALLMRARTYAKRTLLVFGIISAIGIVMLLAGFDVPGRAFLQ